MSAFLDDYHRLVHDAGYVALEDWTCLGVRGADRASFLNNLCTNHVVKLQPGQGCEAFFTDVKGHILAHVMLVCRPDEILVWTVPEQAAPLLAHLDKYLIREDVTLQDRSSNVQLIALAGEKAWQTLPQDSAAELAEPLANCHATADQIDVLLARCAWFGSNAILIECGVESTPSVLAFLLRQGAFACDPAALELLRVESGTPYFGIDFDARNLPQEVNRNEAAISFTKGCYLGQETVARIDALGHVNKLLLAVRFDGDQVPPPGTPLLADAKEAGQVTSAVWSPRAASPLALAMIRRGYHEPGTILESTAGPARVQS